MKKGEKRRQELLKIAYELFITRGYENTSVDEIIDKAQIAKGTYYYYFPSKEQMLEEVIEMMIDAEAEMARHIMETTIPVPQKIVGIITSLKPLDAEQPIKDALHQPENTLMHHKVRKKLIEMVMPLLVEVVEEGIREGIFDCDKIAERVKMLLILSDGTFNEGTFRESDISVFIDISEKLLGAQRGTMGFLADLIDKSEMEDGK